MTAAATETIHPSNAYQHGYDTVNDRADELRAADPAERDKLATFLHDSQHQAMRDDDHAAFLLYTGGLTALAQLTDTTRALRD